MTRFLKEVRSFLEKRMDCDKGKGKGTKKYISGNYINNTSSHPFIECPNTNQLPKTTEVESIIISILERKKLKLNLNNLPR